MRLRLGNRQQEVHSFGSSQALILSITSCERKIWVHGQEIWVHGQEKSVTVVSYDEANLLAGTFRPERGSESALFSAHVSANDDSCIES
jgi:hypothetical protein